MNFGFDDDLINNVTDYAIFNEWDAETSTPKKASVTKTSVKATPKAPKKQNSARKPVSNHESIFDKIKRLSGKA